MTRFLSYLGNKVILNFIIQTRILRIDLQMDGRDEALRQSVRPDPSRTPWLPFLPRKCCIFVAECVEVWEEYSTGALLLESPINTQKSNKREISQRIKFKVFFRSSFLSEFSLYFLVFLLWRKFVKKRRFLYWIGDQFNKNSYFLSSIFLLFLFMSFNSNLISFM